MAFKCPSCGGFLTYGIDSKLLECAYCSTKVSVLDYKKSNEALKSAEDSQGFKVDTYLCKNCGAELVAPEEQIVSYCNYCGGEATLLNKSQDSEKPKYIVPFKFSKEALKANYKAAINHAWHVPKEFTNPEFIESFKGIYIPYWRTKTDIGKTAATLTGSTFDVEGSYDVTREYEYKVQMGGEIYTGSFDASEAFDDTIAAEIAPFYQEDIEPFNEGYLAGFYADKSNVEVETYLPHIEESFYDEISEGISTASKGISTARAEIVKAVPYSGENLKSEISLFPIWFLTWKKGNRVAYSVMNGQTGTCSMDIPVSLASFFKTSLIGAAILYLIMCIFPSFIIPLHVASYTSMLMFISCFFLNSELKKIRLKENHVYDYGNKKVGAKKELPWKKSPKWIRRIKGFLIFCYVVVIIRTGALGFLAETTKDLKEFYLYMMVLQGIAVIFQLGQVLGIKKKFALIPIIFAFLVQVAGYLVGFSNVQNDYYHYGLAIANLSAMILNYVFCGLYFNYMITRPVPNFFTRKGAPKGAGNE